MNQQLPSPEQQVATLSQVVIALKAEVYDAHRASKEVETRYQQLLGAIFEVIKYKPEPDGLINSNAVLEALKAGFTSA